MIIYDHACSYRDIFLYMINHKLFFPGAYTAVQKKFPNPFSLWLKIPHLRQVKARLLVHSHYLTVKKIYLKKK